jgi:2'-phosphotransferase
MHTQTNTSPQMQWPRLKSLKVTVAEIKAAVADNAKQRFAMKPNPSVSPVPDPSSDDPAHWLIRANQGHSIAMDAAALLLPITQAAGNVPDVVVHGTYFAFYQAIVDSGGLKRMNRNHIHFSTGLPEDKAGGVISGMRGDAEVLIYIDIKKSLDDGVLWWISENGVVLTDGDESEVLGTKYFQKVVGRRDDIGVLWEDGQQKAELPERFRGRKPPMGKGQAPRGQGGSKRGGKKDG